MPKKRRKRKAVSRIKKKLKQDPSIHRSNLRALRPRSYYKNDKAYIKAVYRANKEYIDSHISEGNINKFETPEKAFNAFIEVQMDETNYDEGRKYNLEEAIKKVANSYKLNPTWNKSNIKANNFLELIKKDKGIYDYLRKNEFRENGRFAKYDPSKLRYKGQYNDGYSNVAVYQYGDTIIIERKSPIAGMGASIYAMEKFEFEQAVGKSIFEVK